MGVKLEGKPDSDGEPDDDESWGKWKGQPKFKKCRGETDNAPEADNDNDTAPTTRAISWPRMRPGMPPMMPPHWEAPAWQSFHQWGEERQQRDRCKEEDMAPEAQPEATHSKPKSILKNKRMAGTTQPCQPMPAPHTEIGRKPAAVPDGQSGTDRTAYGRLIPVLAGGVYVLTPEQTAATTNCRFCLSESDMYCEDCMEPVCDACIVREPNIFSEFESYNWIPVLYTHF